MSTIKSSTEHLTLNADGSGKEIKFQANGTEKAKITSTGVDVTGNVDINNSVPILKLTDTDDSSYSRVYNSAGGLYLDADKGDGVSGSVIQFGVDDVARMRIDSSGNVGIGTDSPAQELDISSANPAVRLTDTSTSGLYHEVVSYGNDLRFSADGGNVEGSTDIEFLIDGTEHLKIRSDGRGLSQFTAKAWVNFNGTGTVSIRDSHNVSSITDNGTGEWAANYSNSMSNANYSATTANSYVGGSYDITYAMISGYSTSNISFYTQQEDSGVVDVSTMNIQVFGD